MKDRYSIIAFGWAASVAIAACSGIPAAANNSSGHSSSSGSATHSSASSGSGFAHSASGSSPSSFYHSNSTPPASTSGFSHPSSSFNNSASSFANSNSTSSANSTPVPNGFTQPIMAMPGLTKNGVTTPLITTPGATRNFSTGNYNPNSIAFPKNAVPVYVPMAGGLPSASGSGQTVTGFPSTDLMGGNANALPSANAPPDSWSPDSDAAYGLPPMNQQLDPSPYTNDAGMPPGPDGYGGPGPGGAGGPGPDSAQVPADGGYMPDGAQNASLPVDMTGYQDVLPKSTRQVTPAKVGASDLFPDSSFKIDGVEVGK